VGAGRGGALFDSTIAKSQTNLMEAIVSITRREAVVGGIAVATLAATTTPRASGSPTLPGQLTIKKLFDTNTGSRERPGPAFGNDAKLANNYFNAVDEACGNFQNWFCAGTPRTITIQFGYGTKNNVPFVGGAGGSDSGDVLQPWSGYRSALQANALTSNAQSAFNSLPVADPSAGTFGLKHLHAAGLGLEPNSPGAAYIGLNAGLTWFWTQARPDTNWDAVGVIMHEMSECMGRFRSAPGSAIDEYPLGYYAFSAAHTRTFSPGGYFSFDDGVTGSENLFYTGRDRGDWNGLRAPGGIDACNGSGATGLQVFTSLDKTVMDCLGWEWNGR
jgi:hypothetical protein